MLQVSGKKQGEMLEVITEETASQEDLQTFRDALEEKLLQEEPVNLLFLFKHIEGNTPKALLEAMKIIPYLKSIKKSAIVSDGTLTNTDETIEKLIPGVEVAHYSLDELETAREWLHE